VLCVLALQTVILIEFSGFECPFCEKYSKETFGLIDQKFVATGQLRYAFRHFPLEQMHPNALAAAEAAECASNQGKFWEMRGLLFTNQKDLSQRFWQRDIPSIGLDPTACRLSERRRAVESSRRYCGRPTAGGKLGAHILRRSSAA